MGLGRAILIRVSNSQAPAVYTHTLKFDLSSSDQACFGASSPSNYYSLSPDVEGATLYEDQALTLLAMDGYYSNGTLYYIVSDGLGIAGGGVYCSVTTPPPPLPP